MLLIKMYIPPLKHCFIGETSVLTAYNVGYAVKTGVLFNSLIISIFANHF